MFEPRSLSAPVAAVRDECVPEAIVIDCDRDFETLPPELAEGLGPFVERLNPASYPPDWVPAEAPQLLHRYASDAFTIGMPGDGAIAWTRQTTPPVVLVKARVHGSPEAFVDFLLAEALVACSLDVPEHFLGFFEAAYPAFDDVVPLDSSATYQIAAACFDAWVGLHTREQFSTWHDSHPELAATWQDAGTRIEDRVGDLPRAVARGETNLADATELAGAAVKHGLELPAPFAALDTAAYRDHGAPYAIRWAEATFEALTE